MKVFKVIGFIYENTDMTLWFALGMVGTALHYVGMFG